MTIPHKLAALAMASSATARARAIGAANTLLFDHDEGTILADNTDAPALIATLPFEPHGRTALVLGTGGSARAALWALLDAGAAEVRVLSRAPERARALCEELGGTPVARATASDVLVNCTPIGLQATAGAEEHQLPLAASLLDSCACVVDFVYRDGGTPLLLAARARGIGAVDGLALLVGQGALSFEHFTGPRRRWPRCGRLSDWRRYDRPP